MKRILVLAGLLLLMVGLLDAQVIRIRVPPSSFETVTIAYTANTKGLHTASQTDVPASALQSVLSALHDHYKDLLVVDLGNFMGPTPTTILTQGKFDFEVMEKLGYNLLHVSGDELVTGSANLKNRIAETPIPVISGNLTLPGSKAASWTILPCGSRKVGFIGLTSPDFLNLVMANMRQDVVIAEVRAYITQALEEMAGKADIVVALTDLPEAEVAAIRTIPGLDLILTTGGNAAKPGSDWISVGFPGTKQAAIARVLSPGLAVQVLEIHGYPDGNKWTIDEIVGAVDEVTPDTPKDPAMELWLQQKLDETIHTNSRTLGQLEDPLTNDDGKSRQSPLGQTIADLMRSQTKAHLAFVDSGAVRTGLPAGPVTEWDLIEAIPYPDPVVVVKMTGEQIAAVIARSKLKTGEDGYLQYSNLATEPKVLGNRIGSLKLLPDRTYLVAMPEFLAQGGDGYEELKDSVIVERTSLTLADLCRQAFLTYGTLPRRGLPMDEEGHFWFAKLHLSASVDGSVADPQTTVLYPDQVTLITTQQLSSTFGTRLEVNRMDAFWGLENFVDAQYGLSWDEDWLPTQNLDSLQIGSQYSLYLSNLIFHGDRIVDPYVSAVLETALVYPDPTGAMFQSLTNRPGTLKLATGVSAPTLLRPVSLKFGLRWDTQPFDQSQPASLGLEGIVACDFDIVEDVLSFSTSTDVFDSLDTPTQGVTVSSTNQIQFSIGDNFKIGPRVQTYYNTLVGHTAYLFDVTMALDFTFG